MHLYAHKHSLVCEIFVRTADENYIAARWCAINRLNVDFLWLGVHSLEKYLKAVLLINGKPVNKQGHDIVALYDEVKSIVNDNALLPENIRKPDKLKTIYWCDRTTEEFINHILKNGNADNRYLLYGYATFSYDLHMLDMMVFAIRRLICPLDERVIDSNEPGAPTFTHRDLLKSQPEYYERMFMPLDNLINEPAESPKRTAALTLNLAFAPDNFQHEPISSGSSFLNPVISRRIIEPLDSSDRQQAIDAIDVADWFLKNVKVPKDLKKEINDKIDKSKIKHNI